MNRRLLLALALGVLIVIGGAGLVMVATGPRAATSAASPTPGGSPAAVASTGPSPWGQATSPAPSAAASAAPSPTCGETTQLVAVRAVAADTGFPIPVEWTGLGPAGDLFLTLSDVAPRIPIDPAGPASLTVGLGYATGGDRVAFTAGSNTLAYDAATGRLTGTVDTGYGFNSNRATTDAQPSTFDGLLVRPDGSGANGMLTGSIAHAARTFEFRIAMTEQAVIVPTGPGCASARPSDVP